MVPERKTRSRSAFSRRRSLRATLEELGYEVLPTTEYPAAHYPILLEQDLKECFAFVQLIGPYPWKRGGFDRIQIVENLRAISG